MPELIEARFATDMTEVSAITCQDKCSPCVVTKGYELESFTLGDIPSTSGPGHSLPLKLFVTTPGSIQYVSQKNVYSQFQYVQRS